MSSVQCAEVEISPAALEFALRPPAPRSPRGACRGLRGLAPPRGIAPGTPNASPCLRETLSRCAPVATSLREAPNDRLALRPGGLRGLEHSLHSVQRSIPCARAAVFGGNPASRGRTPTSAALQSPPLQPAHTRARSAPGMGRPHRRSTCGSAAPMAPRLRILPISDRLSRPISAGCRTRRFAPPCRCRSTQGTPSEPAPGTGVAAEACARKSPGTGGARGSAGASQMPLCSAASTCRCRGTRSLLAACAQHPIAALRLRFQPPAVQSAGASSRGAVALARYSLTCTRVAARLLLKTAGSSPAANHDWRGNPTIDTVSRKRRSEIMGSVRSRDTGPELFVRRLIYGMGYRYRLHATELPGRPDITLRSRRKVVFVHGCFWHGHDGCPLARVPKSRVAFWQAKFATNKTRDARVMEELRALGYRALTIWECELANVTNLRRKLKRFLDEKR